MPRLLALRSRFQYVLLVTPWHTVSACLAVCALAAGCGGRESIVQGPLSAPPIARPTSIERVNNGAIFQAGDPPQTLFSTDRLPRNVGDTLKVDISEILSASHKVDTNTSRANALAAKGPGSSKTGGLFNSILNVDATASGSDSFKGSGANTVASNFAGQLAVSVINVLSNGNLVVAGEHTLALNGNVGTLRFSGVVNPRDIKAGNVVASADTVNAHVELVGRGDVSDAGSRSWIQRVLANSLSVW